MQADQLQIVDVFLCVFITLDDDFRLISSAFMSSSFSIYSKSCLDMGVGAVHVVTFHPRRSTAF